MILFWSILHFLFFLLLFFASFNSPFLLPPLCLPLTPSPFLFTYPLPIFPFLSFPSSLPSLAFSHNLKAKGKDEKGCGQVSVILFHLPPDEEIEAHVFLISLAITIPLTHVTV